ncbi:MAG: GyrI-like domain-containing protein [Spirochaetaceae bacterium]|nr:GyrI-like domain-containing protein [Spirochaetaceae bacterium]
MDDFLRGNKAVWRWKLTLCQPEWIDGDFVESVRSGLNEADRQSGHLEHLTLEQFTEGPSAQILYIGPFSEEGPTIERLHEAIREKGGRTESVLHKHHEIYLSDFRKTAPDKLRTVIRQSYGTLSLQTGKPENRRLDHAIHHRRNRTLICTYHAIAPGPVAHLFLDCP